MRAMAVRPSCVPLTSRPAKCAFSSVHPTRPKRTPHLSSPKHSCEQHVSMAGIAQRPVSSRARMVRVQAAASTPSPIPASMLEAVEDAVACAAARFKPRLAASTRGPAKGFSAGTAAAASAPNLHVEIPTADTSPASVAQLGLDTATALVKSLGGPAKPLLLVFATPDAAAAADASSAKPAGCRVMELRQACRAPALASQLVVVVAPTVSDVALCQQLVCETWTGRGVLLVNAGFLSGSPAALGLPADLTSFADQVLTVYCLMPVAVKGLLGNKDGLILRRAGPPGKDDGLWRILMRGPGRGEEHFQVGQSKRRPSLDDVQLAFINANAAASPLTKLVSQFKKK